ncbi:NADH dehydrogenase 1 alpha subcomplex assembly factor 3 [Abortiporus biennis]|nr:NADH dehydrogenase 1 alpha subcomplex assembly factor 3 [Abortiporus biennis]
MQNLTKSFIRQQLRTKPLISRTTLSRGLRTSHPVLNTPTALNNILSGGPAPAVQVKSVSNQGIQLQDGLILPSPCIFLEGKTYLWDVPTTFWDDWRTEHFELFDVVVPKPEILLFGTGRKVVLPPPALRHYLTSIAIQIDVMDTWNACSTYNLLAEEGRRVAAALLPLEPSRNSWIRTKQ